MRQKLPAGTKYWDKGEFCSKVETLRIGMFESEKQAQIPDRKPLRGDAFSSRMRSPSLVPILRPTNWPTDSRVLAK